jgi:hypothetical protein
MRRVASRWEWLIRCLAPTEHKCLGAQRTHSCAKENPGRLFAFAALSNSIKAPALLTSERLKRAWKARAMSKQDKEFQEAFYAGVICALLVIINDGQDSLAFEILKGCDHRVVRRIAKRVPLRQKCVITDAICASQKIADNEGLNMIENRQCLERASESIVKNHGRSRQDSEN